jgi:hypothetical protein
MDSLNVSCRTVALKKYITGVDNVVIDYTDYLLIRGFSMLQFLFCKTGMDAVIFNYWLLSVS